MRYVIPILLIAITAACGPNEKKTVAPKVYNADSLRNQFIRANQQVVQKESDEMDYYGKSHQMEFVKTASGVRYFVYQPSAKGDSIRDGDMVTMDYRISLLDGTPVYSSAEDGQKNFKVGQENLESGLHSALTYLKRGDKAIILIPSHLAHGLLGDMKKIPPQMPIVYDVEIQ